MKKTNKQHKRISKLILSFFDRIIVGPINKIINGFTNFFTSNGKHFNKILNSRESLLAFSLLLAVITFFLVDRKFVFLIDSNAEILSGQKVRAEYNEEDYFIEGLPDTVDVTLIGNKWDVYLAKQYPAKEVVVDLKKLTPGKHKVVLKYEQAVSSVKYKVDPSEVSITIYNKISENRILSPDVLNRDKIDSKLNIEDVSLNTDKVIIKGPAYKLEKVSSVKALIDLDRLRDKSKTGTYTLKDLPLVAYDINGSRLDVEIVAEKVEAIVKITAPFKKVPIKIITKGELKEKAIKSIQPSVTSVEIYGTSEALEGVSYLPVEIDVTGLTEDKEYTINLVNPKGITNLSVKTITVKLTVDEIVSKEINDVPISVVNLGAGLEAQAVDKKSGSITVIVKGSKEVIDKITKGEIKATVDLKDRGVGTHEVDVYVTGNDQRLTYIARTKRVSVAVTKSN